MPNPFAPSVWTVAEKYAAYLGPQRSATHLLAHLGDREWFAPNREGEYLTWKQIMLVLLIHNRHINPQDCLSELHRKEVR